MFRSGLPTDLDHEIPRREIGGKRHRGLVGIPELHLAGLHLPHRGLRVGIKFPDRIDPLLAEFQATRHRLLPRKEIQNATTERKLTASRHLGHTLVSRLFQPESQSTGRSPPTSRQLK